MPVKILASGDIHIGLKVSGQDTGMSDFSTKDTWKRMVDWAINNNIDIIALTGDIVERDNRYFEAVGHLQDGFERLKKNNIQVFAVAGNHDFDVLPQIINSGNFDNVRILGAGGKWELIKYEKEKEKLQFAGWSFPSQHVKDNPFTDFDLKDRIDPDIPCIGLLHADFGVTESLYCPVGLPDFAHLNINTWILGHIHKPQELNEFNPCIFYPGSPLALSSKEQGLHSPVLITVNGKFVNKPERVLHSPLRFENINIDITEVKTDIDFRKVFLKEIEDKTRSLEDELIDVDYISYELTLSGRHNKPLEPESWTYGMKEQFRLEIQGTKIGIHKINYNIDPEISNLKELAGQNSAVGILAKIILAIENGQDEEFLKVILDQWKEKFTALNFKNIYLPLYKSGFSDMEAEVEGKKFILNESKKLLGMLIQQKSDY